jgi:hypothetical protein
MTDKISSKFEDAYLARLRKYVGERGQVAAAERVGVSQGSISGWLKATRRPSRDSLALLYKAFSRPQK